MEDRPTLGDYWTVLRRRLLLFFVVASITTSVSVSVASLLPPVYSASAKILVESQQIPTDLARSTVTATAGERLELIRQRIMTRDNLLDLADRMDVFSAQPGMSPGAIVNEMRASILIDSVPLVASGRARAPAGVAAFTITFRAPNATMAARVTNELVNMVLEQNLRARSTRAKETLEFFTNEVGRLSAELAALETEITRFKHENEIALPDSLGYRWSELVELRERIFRRKQEKVALQEQIGLLEEALAGAPGALPDRGPSPEELELQKLRRELVLKRSLFAETHPEIRSLQARIEALEEVVAIPLDDPDAISAGASARGELWRRISSLTSQVAGLDLQKEIDEARQDELTQSIRRTPEVEMTLNALYRAYTDLQTQYDATVQKQAEASTGERLEANRQAERFELIEPAIVPEKPIAPKRAMIAAGGSVAGVALGILLVLVTGMTDRTIRSDRDLQRKLQIKPVAMVPLMTSWTERTHRRLRHVVVLVLVSGGISLGLYMLDRHYMPLDRLGERILNATGLSNVIDMITDGFRE